MSTRRRRSPTAVQPVAVMFRGPRECWRRGSCIQKRRSATTEGNVRWPASGCCAARASTPPFPRPREAVAGTWRIGRGSPCASRTIRPPGSPPRAPTSRPCRRFSRLRQLSQVIFLSSSLTSASLINHFADAARDASAATSNSTTVTTPTTIPAGATGTRPKGEAAGSGLSRSTSTVTSRSSGGATIDKAPGGTTRTTTPLAGTPARTTAPVTTASTTSVASPPPPTTTPLPTSIVPYLPPTTVPVTVTTVCTTSPSGKTVCRQRPSRWLAKAAPRHAEADRQSFDFWSLCASIATSLTFG
jgi:hypothetical protein